MRTPKKPALILALAACGAWLAWAAWLAPGASGEAALAAGESPPAGSGAAGGKDQGKDGAKTEKPAGAGQEGRKGGKPSRVMSLLEVLMKRRAEAPKPAAGAAEGKKPAPPPAEIQRAIEQLQADLRAGGGRVAIENGVIVPGAGEGETEGGEEGNEEGAGETGGGKEGEGPPAPKEPVPPMFYLRDGTRLAGFPEVIQLHVDTAYGSLLIPVSEVERVRFAALEDPQLRDRIGKLIGQLGHEEFDLREEAMEELRKIGPAALEALRKALESESDEEIKSRAEKLVAELEEEGEEGDEEDVYLTPISGSDDEVVTGEFTVKGRVVEESFKVKTRYGTLDFHRGDIVCIVFQEPLVSTKLEVTHEHLAGRGKWFGTGVELAKGNKLVLSASGAITVNNTSCGPEGTASLPAGQFESFTSGSLVGKIGEQGKPFIVGSAATVPVEESGELFLGVALNQGTARGSFLVSVKVEEK